MQLEDFDSLVIPLSDDELKPKLNSAFCEPESAHGARNMRGGNRIFAPSPFVICVRHGALRKSVGAEIRFDLKRQKLLKEWKNFRSQRRNDRTSDSLKDRYGLPSCDEVAFREKIPSGY